MKETTTKKEKPVEKKETPPIEDTGMSVNKMESLLAELTKTHYWPAVKFYNECRGLYIDSVLRTTDAFKEPTIVAKNQGQYNGIFDMENSAEGFRKKIEKEVDEEEKKKKSGGVRKVQGY